MSEPIQLIFCAVIAVSALVASIVSDMRRMVLSMWICGMGIGGLYLGHKMELLAVVQWVTSTLIAISFIFFALLFGEYGISAEGEVRARIPRYVAGIIIGGAFFLWIHAGALWSWTEPRTMGAGGADLHAIGIVLLGKHIVSLEVLALILFSVLIGGGVMIRLHRGREDGGNEQ